MHMQPAPLPNHQNHSWLIDILFLLLVLGGLFFILLGVRPLFVPDEGRYAEIAREMVVNSDYITPHLNNIKYFEKPILFYWLGAGAIKLAGLNLWSLRSINAILGLLGCLLTYVTARKLYDRTTGILAALILGTSILYFVMAHMISLDLPVTVFLAATLYSFLLGSQHPPGQTRRFYLWGASIAAACAVLTKGLIGIVFPSMIIVSWIALTEEWRILNRLYLPSCVLLFLLIAVPWHILVGQRNPEFYYFYFIQQHLLRYTTMKVGHYQPAWFFIPNLMIGFFPWIIFLPQALSKALPTSWQQRTKNKVEIFFLLWALLIFTFFSFSKSKLIPYILPVFPPLAILTAHYIQQSIRLNQYQGIKIGYLCLLPAAAIIAIVFSLYPQYTPIPDPKTAIIYLNLAALILIISSLTAYIYTYQNIAKSIVITIFSTWLLLLVSLAAIPSIDNRTIAPLAMKLKSLLTAEDEVIAYNQYYQDLPFYLEQRITILNWKNELYYGMAHQNTDEWMIKDSTFWQRWHSEKRIFSLMGTKEYQDFSERFANEKHYIIGRTINNVLFSNKNISAS
ncbi:MAG: phospholipid carrier-dependent glycosyltransferase [Gammaproteobacteria bacterium]|nr:phospholipid carrier-dependent glycosyltransferase [Gammaproteobacteria bacterium]MCW5583892.1 phospholipid carrier-dependent glycosyltransferase [Gammaproteobacteria bacterium]